MTYLKWKSLMKMPKPPSWEAMRMFNIFMVVFCGSLALVTENKWLAVLDAFVAGTSFAAVGYITMFLMLRRKVDAIEASFKQMSEFTEALINDRVTFHVTRGMPDDDVKPRLH